jgi:hypothetical protein
MVHAMMSHGFISLLTRRNILPDLPGTILGTTITVHLSHTSLLTTLAVSASGPVFHIGKAGSQWCALIGVLGS